MKELALPERSMGGELLLGVLIHWNFQPVLSQAVQFGSGWKRVSPAPELHKLAAGSKRKGSVYMGGGQRPANADIKSTEFSF